MADTQVNWIRTDNQTVVPIKAIDNGDGTFSFATSSQGGQLSGKGTPGQTCPSITTATSVAILAANPSRKYLYLENNSSVPIGISLKGVDPTGIVPTLTNEIIVLQPGQWYESPPNYCPTSAIKAYQTSGATINTLSVVEG